MGVVVGATKSVSVRTDGLRSSCCSDETLREAEGGRKQKGTEGDYNSQSGYKTR